jgi:hypothetical protein
MSAIGFINMNRKHKPMQTADLLAMCSHDKISHVIQAMVLSKPTW